MNRVLQVLERISSGIGYAASLVILPLIAVTVFEVLSRRLLGEPTIWAYELGYMLTGAHFLLGAGLTLAKGAHIRIDLVYDRLSARGRAAIDFAFYVLLFLPFLIFLTEALWSYMAQAFASDERTGASAWNPPIWPFRLIFCVGFASLLLQVVVETVKALLILTGRASAPQAGRAE